ncbi:MAG: hypothetical protein ABSC49_02750 [Candidatus Microgenomates bacterium]|jgi:hypothetical protein
MRKYDWPNLKQEFLTGKWLSVATFFREKGIRNNSRSRLNASGWIKERKNDLEQIVSKSKERIIESEVEIRIRQAEAAKTMQRVGLERLDKLSPETAEDARKLVTSGLEQERRALGLEGTTHPQRLTQINFNELPKTKFDAMLDGKSAEELLELLAEIRKERERRRNLAVTVK